VLHCFGGNFDSLGAFGVRIFVRESWDIVLFQRMWPVVKSSESSEYSRAKGILNMIYNEDKSEMENSREELAALWMPIAASHNFVVGVLGASKMVQHVWAGVLTREI
jgi:K+/H+ antiporter YhaU regulatory subunit KhtT